jgi:hypothetical protein
MVQQLVPCLAVLALLIISTVHAKSTALGCFRDAVDVKERVLPNVLILDPKMTTDMCTAICDCRGFPYAGTQFGTEVLNGMRVLVHQLERSPTHSALLLRCSSLACCSVGVVGSHLILR